MQNKEHSQGIGAAARVTALASSIMDLHVRIALKEVSRERRRLISGGIFLAMGGVLMLFTLLALEIVLIIWMQNTFNLNFEIALLIIGSLITLGSLSYWVVLDLATKRNFKNPFTHYSHTAIPGDPLI